MSERADEERFRAIFRRVHADHPECLTDEWLMEPCRDPDGVPAHRPIVWSRRNGPWRAVDVLWVGAAPGNAGGMGAGDMGAHATRIPFGGDIAGANLDLLLESAGLDRNTTFIVAALNQLPDRGGGEPRVAELRRRVGGYASSIHLLRDTLLAARPRLVVALGNLALRSTIAAGHVARGGTLTLPGLAPLRSGGLERGRPGSWPADFRPDAAFMHAWTAGGARSLPALLWLLHPSAQNMSPHARVGTAFHTRMVETRAALRRAVADCLGTAAARAGRGDAGATPREPVGGVYALPEWRDAIGHRHVELIRLWRQKGL